MTIPLEMRKGIREQNVALASAFNLVEQRDGPSKAQFMIHELRARESLMNEMPVIHVDDPQQVSDELLKSVPPFPFVKERSASQQEEQPQPGKIMPDGNFVCSKLPPLDYSPCLPNTLSVVSQPERDQPNL